MNEDQNGVKNEMIPSAPEAETEIINKESVERCSRTEILDVINMISPVSSRLSPEYIEEKNLYGFIDTVRDYFVNGYPVEYEDDPDACEINDYIRKLSYMLYSAVKSGSELEANSAIAGIYNSIEIQSELSVVKKIYKDTYEEYIKSCREYFKCFISLTSVSRRVDDVSKEVENYKQKLDEKEKKYNDTVDKIKKYIVNDKQLISDITQFKDNTYNDSSQLWSREMHELYNDLVSLKIQQFNIKYEKFQLDAGEKELHKNSAVREQLISSLGTKPSPDSIDAMKSISSVYKNVLKRSNKVNEEFIQLFDRMKEMKDEMDRASIE